MTPSSPATETATQRITMFSWFHSCARRPERRRRSPAMIAGVLLCPRPDARGSEETNPTSGARPSATQAADPAV